MTICFSVNSSICISWVNLKNAIQIISGRHTAGKKLLINMQHHGITVEYDPYLIIPFETHHAGLLCGNYGAEFCAV